MSWWGSHEVKYLFFLACWLAVLTNFDFIWWCTDTLIHWRPCHQVFMFMAALGGVQVSYVILYLRPSAFVLHTCGFWWHLTFLPLRLRLCEFEYAYSHVNCKWYSITRNHFNKASYMLWFPNNLEADSEWVGIPKCWEGEGDWTSPAQVSAQEERWRWSRWSHGEGTAFWIPLCAASASYGYGGCWYAYSFAITVQRAEESWEGQKKALVNDKHLLR